MGTMIDYHFDEIEDMYYDELLNTQDALLRKTRSIGLAQNQGETDGVPSEECCNLLADYLSRITARLEEVRQEAWDEYQELAEYLLDQYMDGLSGSPITLETLLAATDEDILAEGADPYLIISAIDTACAARGIFRNAIGGDPFGRQKIEHTFFTIDAMKRESSIASESWDSVIGAIIDEFEEEL